MYCLVFFVFIFNDTVKLTDEVTLKVLPFNPNNILKSNYYYQKTLHFM